MMFIKSHVRGGFASMRDYLENEGEFFGNKGKNEVVRLVGGKNLNSGTLTEMFREMWMCRGKYPVKTPVHHCSINPDPKGRRLTDDEVWKIVDRMAEKFGYKPGQHQTLIVEHILNGRQHFHVIFNRVNLLTRKCHWPGTKDCGHWLRAKLAAKEMSQELGLTPVWSRRARHLGKALGKTLGKAPPVVHRGHNHQNHSTRPPRHYVGMLGETHHTENGSGSGKGKGDKTGKGDGSGGGAASAMSALKSSAKTTTPPVKKYSGGDIGKGNGPERRKVNAWVAVERRRQGPKPK